jgi:hypothetical protein
MASVLESRAVWAAECYYTRIVACLFSILSDHDGGNGSFANHKLTDGVVVLSHEWLQLHSIDPTCRVYDLPNAVDLGPYRPIAQNAWLK